MFLTKEHSEHSHRLHEFAAEIRGKFLNSTAWIETLLNDILAGYFCPNDKRRGLFFSEVVNDMRLSAKTAVLDKILQREFPDILTAYPRLRKRLDCLRKFRNRLAHAHIDTSELALTAKKVDEVTFIFYDDGQNKRQRITRAEASRRGKEANQLRDDLLKIQARVTKRA